MSALATERQATLDELAAIANREHAHVHQLEAALAVHANRFGSQMLGHAFRAGAALAEAKSRCEEGGWLKWLAANFDATPYTAASYIRVAFHRDAIMAANAKTLAEAVAFMRENDLKGPTRPGGRYQLGHAEEVREEARRLHSEGLGTRAIAMRLDIGRQTVRRWIDPEYAHRIATHHAEYRRARKDELAARRKAKYEADKQREAEAKERRVRVAVKKAGAAHQEAYAIAERMQDVLAQAQREAVDSEAKQALSLAWGHWTKMRDEIVRALGVS